VDVSVQDSGHSIFDDDIGIYSQRQSDSFPSPDVLPELRRNNLLLYCCIYRSYYWDITNGTVSPTLVLYPSTSNDSSSTTLAIVGFIIKDVCIVSMPPSLCKFDMRVWTYRNQTIRYIYVTF
jgi:hypothetical protein